MSQPIEVRESAALDHTMASVREWMKIVGGAMASATMLVAIVWWLIEQKLGAVLR